MDDSLGPWEPIGLADLRRELDGCPARWWITGGHALERHVGRSWRAHDDTDLGICRVDAPAVLGYLVERGWETVIAAAGVLGTWDGGELSADDHQNNVWCRRVGGPWQLDLTIGDGDDEHWIYRRDPTLRRPWSEAVHDLDGMGHLAPELQLLFKSVSVRTKDTVDAVEVIPTLGAGGVALLHARLGADHPWRALVDRHRKPFGEADALEVLDVLGSTNIDAWVDGGWAVDALVGYMTRDHADLDLALRSSQFDEARLVLADHGFRLVRDDGPFNVVVLDDRGRLVDLHAFDLSMTVTDDDGIERCAGAGLAYEANGFTGVGSIAGRPVPCISPETLVRYHTGYEPDAEDWHDIRLLDAHFGIPVPAMYRRFAEG